MLTPVAKCSRSSRRQFRRSKSTPPWLNMALLTEGEKRFSWQLQTWPSLRRAKSPNYRASTELRRPKATSPTIDHTYSQ